MSLPKGRSNGTVTIFDNVDELGLALTAVSASITDAQMGNNATLTSSDIPLGVKGSLFVMVEMTSGSLTVEVDEFADSASHDFSSPVESMTVTGTNSDFMREDFSSSSTLNMGVKLTAGSSGCQIASLLVVYVTETTHKAEWHDVGSAHNVAQDALTNDGSGVVSVTPAADHTFPA